MSSKKFQNTYKSLSCTMTILEHFEFLKLVLIKVGRILAGTRLPFFHVATPVHLVLYDVYLGIPGACKN